jgi:hypothetical protein
MSKKLTIEKANRRLLNESMPPMVYFNEFEVVQMLSEAVGCEDSTKLPPKVIEVLKQALLKKGRNLNPPNVPNGAMM